jgi:hypothetical protein
VRAFLATAGSCFGLVVVAHIARVFVEPHMAGDPWFWLITVIAAGLSAWAWRLFWIARTQGTGR